MNAFRKALPLFLLFSPALLSSQASALAQEKATNAEEKKKSSEEEETQRLNRQKDLLNAENAMREARLKKELAEQSDEKSKLDLKISLVKARLQAELAEMEAEKTRLSMQNELQEARNRQKLADLEAERKRLEAEASLAQQKLKAELAQLEAQKSRLAAENSLMQEELQKEIGKLKMENQRIELENKQKAEEIRRLELQFNEEKQTNEQQLARLRSGIQLRDEKEKWEAQVNHEIAYPKEPFQNGVLTVSDRRIPLNGPIITGVADYVVRRIDYFNNQSTADPIFLVIDRCPGGSVMEGYRIVKAIETSKAPIHVLVTSYAASMAAVITTLADRSYAFPNAIILHHQMSSGIFGNMTQMKEQLAMAQEWARRLHEPVAKKMGVSGEEFTKRMYARSSDGDWEEFGDVAVKLKWVDHIVTEIRELGIKKKPTDAMPSPWFFFFGQDLKEEKDLEGRAFLRLPRLDPFDFYFIYNPDKYYR